MNQLNLSKNTEKKLINTFSYQTFAQKLLEPAIFDYFAGASSDEITLKANQTDFQNLKIVPSMLNDVSNINLKTTILGTTMATPIMLAPVAFQSLAYPNGEIETAKASSLLKTIMILSTLSTTSLEDVVKLNPEFSWFQLYVFKDQKINLDLIIRAKEAGYKAIVVTVDSQYSGKRERDWLNNFNLPHHLKLANLTNYQFAKSQNKTSSWLHNFIDDNYDKSFTWNDLESLINSAQLPVIIKGILNVNDAHKAKSIGASGIIISNHGGRSIDTAITSIQALENIGSKINSPDFIIILDSGIRRGTDIFKALALGAKAVCIGRPYIWGLAIEKAQGVVKIVDILNAELTTTMGLAGVNDVNKITKDYLAQA